MLACIAFVAVSVQLLRQYLNALQTMFWVIVRSGTGNRCNGMLYCIPCVAVSASLHRVQSRTL